MSKRRFQAVLGVFFILSVTLSAAAAACWSEMRRMEQTLDYSEERAFSELVQSVSNLDAALIKQSSAMTFGMQNRLAAQIFREASVAKACLSQLPVRDSELENTHRFLSQAGEYAYSMIRKISHGETVTPEERETIRRLAETAETLADRLLELKVRFDAGELRFRERQSIFGTAKAASEGDGFGTFEQDFPETPTLIYDGPFSDHIDQNTAKHLKNQAPCTEQEAKSYAAELFGLPETELRAAGDGGGTIESYVFLSGEGKTEQFAEITKQGGFLLSYFAAEGEADKTPIDEESAALLAINFLDKHGYPSMQKTYSVRSDDVITMNFAYREGEVLCYPDLIKISVRLSTGTICEADARGYLMNHQPRSLSIQPMELSEAQAQISPGLTVIRCGAAVIPTAGENEVLCQEILCITKENQHVLFYLHAETGREENILLLLEDENGTLVI